MRRIIHYIVLCNCLTISFSSLCAQSAEGLLSSAIYEEEINGELEAAILIYEQIVEQYGDSRKSAAEALFRLGVIHEKLGFQKAQQYYSQLLNYYSDQELFAQGARLRLQQLQKKEDLKIQTQLTAPSPEMLKTTKVYYPDAIRSVSPDGRYLCYGSRLGNLTIYDQVTSEIKKLTPDPTNKDYGRSLGAKGISNRSIWSPDGKKIAYFWVRKDEGDDLRIFDLESGKIRVLCPYKEEGVPYPFEWTRDGKYILGEIRNKKEDTWKIVLIRVEDGTIEEIKTLPKNEMRRATADAGFTRASISPDGQHIIYDDINENNKKDLHVLSLDGSIDRQLLGNFGSNEEDPLFLRDGKSFLFFSDQSKASALWKAELNDEMQVERTELLVEGLGWLYTHVGLTDDGPYYYWSHVRIANLYTADVDLENGLMSKGVMVGSNDLEQRISPTWSQDGKKIAYLKVLTGAQDKIEIKDLESGTEQFLHLELGPDRKISYQPPAWSKDGSKLLLVVRNSALKPGVSYFSGNVFEIIVADIESGDFLSLTINGHHPIFGKEGMIYFLRDRSIMELDVESGREEEIYSDDKGRVANNIKLSPDGKLLAFTAGTDRTKVLLLSLEDNKIISISIQGLEGRISGSGSLNWIEDGKSLFIISDSGNPPAQHFYHVDVSTEFTRIVGETIEGADQVFLAADFHHGRSQLVYVLRKNTINLWKLENY